MQEFLAEDMEGKIIYSIHIPKLQNAHFRSFKVRVNHIRGNACSQVTGLGDLLFTDVMVAVAGHQTIPECACLCKCSFSDACGHERFYD